MYIAKLTWLWNINEICTLTSVCVPYIGLILMEKFSWTGQWKLFIDTPFTQKFEDWLEQSAEPLCIS